MEGRKGMKTYRIKDWDNLYENNRTRDMVKMQWLPLPNRHDSDGYTSLIDRKNGAAIYGAWVAILQVASRCAPRGSLVRDGDRPHDAQSLARMTRIPVTIIEEALTICSVECKWLEINGCDDGATEPAPSPRFSAPSSHPTDEEGKGREGIEGKGTAGAEPGAVVEAWNATKLPKVANMTTARTAALKARLSEPFFRDNWQEAITKVAASDFCRGATDRGNWKATFDWFITPDAAVKVIEGKYDNQKPRNGNAPNSITENIKVTVFEP